VVRAFEASVVEMQDGELLPKPAGPVATRPFTAVLPPPRAAEGDAPLDAPLTEPQREVWLAAQLSPAASCAFNESFTLALDGRLDEDSLVRAVKTLVARHDALRTTFDAAGERQVVRRELAIDVPLVDLSGLDSAAQDEWMAKTIEEEAALPFDLVNGPLFRARLVRLAPERHLLVATAHHLVCDGWSTNVLLDELARLYAADHDHVPAALGRASSFAAYAREEAARAPDAETDRFWRERFADPPPHQSGKIMVCGHTSQQSGLPRNIGHAVCIDTFVYGDGWLTCLDVANGQYWQANQKGETRGDRLSTEQ
jgi:hypothetical protein